jgi:L-amino acid N-acyltransferase YncA
MREAKTRAASSADIAAITAIYRPAVEYGTASFELDPPDVAEMGRRFEAITGAGYPYLVAEVEGRVVGFAYANAFRPRRAYRYSVENSVYVESDSQGQGVGILLLSTLIEACTAKQYRQMIAVIGDSAQQASIRLHRRMGFTFSGTIHSVGFKHGRWLDSVIMQLPLGPGATSPP